MNPDYLFQRHLPRERFMAERILESDHWTGKWSSGWEKASAISDMNNGLAKGFFSISPTIPFAKTEWRIHHLHLHSLADEEKKHGSHFTPKEHQRLTLVETKVHGYGYNIPVLFHEKPCGRFRVSVHFIQCECSIVLLPSRSKVSQLVCLLACPRSGSTRVVVLRTRLLTDFGAILKHH